MVNNKGQLYPELGATIRLLRLERSLTQAELAQAVGVSPVAIVHYEDNSWRPGTAVLTRIADTLQVSIPELTGGCRLLCDGDGTTVIVRQMAGNRIKVVGTCKTPVPSLEGDE